MLYYMTFYDSPSWDYFEWLHWSFQESKQFSQSTLLLASSLSVVSTRSISISKRKLSCFVFLCVLYRLLCCLKTDSNAHMTHKFSVPNQSSSALSLESKRQARRPRRALYGHCTGTVLAVPYWPANAHLHAGWNLYTAWNRCTQTAKHSC